MVGCASYRNPALLAKITSTIDVISGGRLDWGIGAGWYENEYLAYGYDFPRPAQRIAGLADTVEIVKRMWTEPEASFSGRIYSVFGAQCDPKPLQQPHPPIWIGGGGEQLTLRVVAEHADYSNFGGDLQMWTHKRDVLRSHCDVVGRDPAEIRMTWSPEILIRETAEEVSATAAVTRRLWGADDDAWRAGNLIGTAEQVGEKLATYVDAGVAGVVGWCSDYPDTETLERLARDVIPKFR
jgi:alkanesulfonate monooxygenase SsuD/methylene tetrahydromethanopterin reductase-like flavin-dependent oxidoreductase (luciferase family)